MNKALLVFLLAGLLSCSDSGSGRTKDTATVSGKVWFRAIGDEVADGATVEAWLDANEDGKISDNEKISTETNWDGHFSFQVPVGTKPTVIAFSRSDCATQYKTVKLQPGSHAELEVVLFESLLASCQGGVCIDPGGAISVTTPQAAQSRLRLFNPAYESQAFPGEFRDSEGKILISSVFASIEVFDQDDNPIKNLPAGQLARLEMRLPRDTWKTIYDLEPGDDRIQIPMYYFDKNSGQWKRDGTGWLTTASGEPLAESQLSQLTAGNFSEDVYAVAEVSHFTYWNVDWPEEENTSLTFQVVDVQGRPVTGALCFVVGENFPGNSRPLASGTGTECVDLWRSEKNGENLNGNGITGEKRRAYVICVWNGKYYRFAPFQLPEEVASCPQASLDLQKLKLDQNSEVPVQLCTVRGKVFLNGAPEAQVTISAEDPAVPDEAAQTLCGQSGCLSVGVSGDDGSFEVTNVMALGLKLTAFTVKKQDSLTMYLKAENRFLLCPEAPVEVHLYMEQCYTELPEISVNVSSGEINWQPAIKTSSLMVTSEADQIKWLVASQNGFLPPVKYGQVPYGALQFKPESGKPASLASGDVITVVPVGGYITLNGYRCTAYSHAVVP